MKLKNKLWFTLVEIIVALTIFSIIMISVMSVYIFSSETTYNSEITRSMHENIKNIVLDISEDVVKNGIEWVSDSISSNNECSFAKDENNINIFKQWFIFCTRENTYTVAKKNSSGTFLPVSDPVDCDNINSECYLIKQSKTNSWEYNPLTNSLVTIRDLKFRVTNNWVKKVSIFAKIQPSIKAWVRPSLIEKNIFNLQTTLSERTYNNK